MADLAEDILVRSNIPRLATKQLKFRLNGERRILTISSNLLMLFGFEKGAAVREVSLGRGKGIEIHLVTDLFDKAMAHIDRFKRVYSRRYPKRRNNPLEHLVEVSSQRLINESFPADCQRVHIEFSDGLIRVTPIHSVQERVLANAEKAEPNTVFAALTSGVDLSSMRESGLKISAVLEWRPQEKRDSKDLSETGMLNALANSGPIHAVFNEDITCCAIDRIAKAMERHPTMIFHASPQCDDHSNVKSNKAKEQAAEDGSTTADMIIDLLNLIERVGPPVVIFENVPGMLKSPAYELAKLRMKRWGYRCEEHCDDPTKFGGLTTRKRAYVVFSMLDAPFAFEAPSPRPARDIWSMIAPYLDECRDVSHSKSLQDGEKCGRQRAIRPGSTTIPTVLKSQPRMAKDSVVIVPEPGKILWPSERLLKFFLGIQSVDLNSVGSEIASEIIGQSIDRPHHEMVIRSVMRHIALWLESRAMPKLAMA